MLFENGKTDAIPKLKIALCELAYRHEFTVIKKTANDTWLSRQGQDFHALCIRQSEFSSFSLVKIIDWYGTEINYYINCMLHLINYLFLGLHYRKKIVLEH